MSKQKNISVVQNSKENTSPIPHGDALRALYGRMAGTHGADNPLMIEFAGIIAGHEDADGNDDILNAVDKIDLSVEILDDLLKLVLVRCAAVDNLGEAQSAIMAARRYAGDIRQHTAVIATGARA